jgi:hypothetical protein
MKFLHCLVIFFAFLTFISCENREQENTELLTSQDFDEQQMLSTDSSEKTKTIRYQVGEEGKIVSVTEGVFAPIKNARLGPPVRFLSEVDDDICYQLFIDNQEVGWIFSAYQAKSHLILFKCTTYEGEPFSPGTKYGGGDISSMWEVNKQGNNWVLKDIQVPHLVAFSNPNICNGTVAYWGSNNNTYYASIFDFNEKTLLKEIKIGKDEIDTDYSGFFPVPEWNKECNKIIFPKNNYQKEDITIQLNK